MSGEREKRKEEEKKREKVLESFCLFVFFSGFQSPNIYLSRIFETKFRFTQIDSCFSIFS